MTRTEITNKIGIQFLTTNIEEDEYSYVKEAGSKANLEKLVGHKISHYKVDRRFEKDDFVILVETKPNFVDSDEEQLRAYLEEERALHKGKKVICILANTNNDEIKVFKSFVDETHYLKDENILEDMEYYISLFDSNKSNDREKVLKNTYELNKTLHKLDIDEKLRSQFVGTILLYIKDILNMKGNPKITKESIDDLNKTWETMKPKAIIGAIEGTLESLLDGSDNKAKKIELLQKNVLQDQKVKKLTTQNWIQILNDITLNIYKYIDTESSEGQDILNLFFIAFNKYTGKADKNQAFTPDHITDFMCRVTDVDRTKRVLDGTCGSGSFLVQALAKELADCKRGMSNKDAKELIEKVKKEHIYGIEVEEKAYGLAITNMLIHGDGNSNIKFGSIFDSKEFIKLANPDIILMNPPYNAKPITIPSEYKKDWGKAVNGKEDPTKGLVFIQYLADIIKELNIEREKEGINLKHVKCAVLLPMSCAIGGKKQLAIEKMKINLLKNNTLEAVFSLPTDMFHPGATPSPCCMIFTLGKPHINTDGTVNETFFGYYREDGFKKKKNIGRIEQFDKDGNSIWKSIENEWLSLYRNKSVIDGKSAKAVVSGTDEWLCEAYMKTDYSTLTDDDFQQTINNYIAYLIKEGNIYET